MNKFLFFISFLILSCASKTPEVLTPAVKVSVASTNVIGSDRVEAFYETNEKGCRVAWQTTAYKKENRQDVQLINRTDCKLSFSDVAEQHEKIIARILKDYPVATIKSITTGGFYTLQPDKSWNRVLAEAASKSSEYKDFRKNYPKHKSQKSANAILVDLILQTQPHVAFKALLARQGLNFEIGGVEKVFQTKNEKGETVIDDAGMMWWRPLNVH